MTHWASFGITKNDYYFLKKKRVENKNGNIFSQIKIKTR